MTEQTISEPRMGEVQQYWGHTVVDGMVTTSGKLWPKTFIDYQANYFFYGRQLFEGGSVIPFVRPTRDFEERKQQVASGNERKFVFRWDSETEAWVPDW